MQQNFSFRSKSASLKQDSSFPQQWTFDLKPLIKNRQQDSIVNPERDMTKPQLPLTIKIPSETMSSFKKEEAAPVRGMSRDPTAIHQLQKLITPRGNELDFKVQQMQNTLKYKDQILQKKDYIIQEKKNHHQQVSPSLFIKSSQQYQRELKKVSMMLFEEQHKNSHLQKYISKLQRRMTEVEKQKKQILSTLTQVKGQNKMTKLKYSQLQQLSKQQMVINLELEALIGRVLIKNKEKVKNQAQIIEGLKHSLNGREDKFMGKLKALEEEYQKTKNMSEEQITNLLMELKNKSSEINRLKNNIKMMQMEQQTNFEKVGGSTIPSNHMDNSKQEVETKFSRYGHKVSEDFTNQIPSLADHKPEDIFKLTSKVFEQGSTKVRPYSKTDRV